MYSFIDELEFALAERDKKVIIDRIDYYNQVNLMSYNNKKLSLLFTIDKIVVRDSEGCYIRSFGYSDEEREKLIDFILVFFEDRRSQCRDLLKSYREEKNYSEYAYTHLLHKLNSLGYLNTFGKILLSNIYDSKINFDKNTAGLHKAVMSIIDIECVDDWNYLFGINGYNIDLVKDND